MQALVWAHLSQQQLDELRTAAKAGAPAGASGSHNVLRQHPCVSGPAGGDASRESILLDLYYSTLQQGQAWALTDEQLSCLFSLVAEVHTASVGQRLIIEHSFERFKDGLLKHSVNRPPFSLGVFNQQQMQDIVDWMLATYYKHYKLYQYAFTTRVTLSLATYHPGGLVEVAPQPQPLYDAIPEDEHQRQEDEQRVKRQAEEEAAAVAAKAVAEAASQAAIDAEYIASIPEELKARMQAALSRETAQLKAAMEEQFQRQTAELLAKIAVLEAGGRK